MRHHLADRAHRSSCPAPAGAFCPFCELEDLHDQVLHKRCGMPRTAQCCHACSHDILLCLCADVKICGLLCMRLYTGPHAQVYDGEGVAECGQVVGRPGSAAALLQKVQLYCRDFSAADDQVTGLTDLSRSQSAPPPRRRRQSYIAALGEGDKLACCMCAQEDTSEFLNGLLTALEQISLLQAGSAAPFDALSQVLTAIVLWLS